VAAFNSDEIAPNDLPLAVEHDSTTLRNAMYFVEVDLSVLLYSHFSLVDGVS
jgi:hypothetical protein